LIPGRFADNGSAQEERSALGLSRKAEGYTNSELGRNVAINAVAVCLCCFGILSLLLTGNVYMRRYDLPVVGRLYRQIDDLKKRLDELERPASASNPDTVAVLGKLHEESSHDSFRVYVTNRPEQGVNLLSELRRRIAVDCADYAQEHMTNALHFELRERLLEYVTKEINLSKDQYPDGLCLEFGVYKGHSINFLSKRVPDRRFYGFDSFEGLHVDWKGNDLSKGAFDVGGVLPAVEPNVTLHKGWFDKTLPTFFAENPGPIFFVSHDCDTYEAAKIVFKFTADRLRPGTMIVFDDYWGYRGWRSGEHLAWLELVEERKIKYEYLAFTIQQVFVRIISIGA
jgi:hypothetical protein